MNEVTDKQKKDAVALILAIAQTIQEAGEIPSGHLYAHLMGIMSLETYQQLISALKNANVIKESNHLLTWTGPKLV